MANVIITTYDGKVYTNPEDIKVERNENTEMFYRFLEQYRDERIQKREDTASGRPCRTSMDRRDKRNDKSN